MAPQVGLEPTTYGLTVRRSNQLSYWGTPFNGRNTNARNRSCQLFAVLNFILTIHLHNV